MSIADKCPECGAERPTWMGGSHYGKCGAHFQREHPKCHDGLTPDEAWKKFPWPIQAGRWNIVA